MAFSHDLKILTSILAIESVIIIVTNAFVFVLYAKFKKLRRNSNYCLVSLAITNILMALVVFPLFEVCNITNIRDACDAMDLVQRFLNFSTILHILLATLDRYLKILSPFRHRTLVTNRRIVGILVLIWFISLAVSLAKIPYLYAPKLKINYAIVVLVVMGIMPFIMILALNVHTRLLIKRRVKASRKLAGATNVKGNHRRTILLYLALATISVTFGPPLYLALGIRVKYGLWVALLYALMFSINFINPLLYTFFKPDFRNALKELTHKGKDHATEAKRKATSQHHVSHQSNCKNANVENDASLPEDAL